MNKFYTTGEVAKVCDITIRTVQFYDKNEIVKPSQLSEGGRRLYSEKDIEKFKYINLYKTLGFSLEEIKDLINEKNAYTSISEYISKQEIKTDSQIYELQKKKNKLHILKEEISSNGKVTIKNIEELNVLVIKQNKHKKTEIMTYIFLGCYMLILFTGLPLATKVGGIYPFIMLVITIILLIALIYYHSSVNAYVCPNCHEKFTIGFIKDLFTLNNGKKGKILRCPYCGHKTSMKETYR